MVSLCLSQYCRFWDFCVLPARTVLWAQGFVASRVRNGGIAPGDQVFKQSVLDRIGFVVVGRNPAQGEREI